jgi:folylpolyglutamate synthase/dihydropteroate synthase
MLVSSDFIRELGLDVNYEVQYENICVAGAVLQYLGVSTKHMGDFYWPCRMELFSVPVDRDGMQKSVRVVVDGCHNGYSLKLFLTGLRLKYPHSELVVLFGAGMDKTVDDMLQVLRQHADTVQFVQSIHFRAMTERDLLDKYKEVLDNTEHRQKLAHTPAPAVDRAPEGTVKSRLCNVIEQYR